jgi:hypothetical protein
MTGKEPTSCYERHLQPGMAMSCKLSEEASAWLLMSGRIFSFLTQ